PHLACGELDQSRVELREDETQEPGRCVTQDLTHVKQPRPQRHWSDHMGQPIDLARSSHAQLRHVDARQRDLGDLAGIERVERSVRAHQSFPIRSTLWVSLPGLMYGPGTWLTGVRGHG